MDYIYSGKRLFLWERWWATTKWDAGVVVQNHLRDWLVGFRGWGMDGAQ